MLSTQSNCQQNQQRPISLCEVINNAVVGRLHVYSALSIMTKLELVVYRILGKISKTKLIIIELSM